MPVDLGRWIHAGGFMQVDPFRCIHAGGSMKTLLNKDKKKSFYKKKIRKMFVFRKMFRVYIRMQPNYAALPIALS